MNPNFLPLINVNENEDEIVFEWWNDPKKITIYVEHKSIEYIKVWGADMDHQMEYGEIVNFAQMLNLWLWLFS